MHLPHFGIHLLKGCGGQGVAKTVNKSDGAWDRSRLACSFEH
jgi:hypothetical protein